MEINKELLLKALEAAKPGLGNNAMIEQSTSFCFLNGNVVTYNDEISISCPVEGLDFEGAVNANELHSFISKAKTEEIEFTMGEKEIILKTGKSKAGLVLDPEIILPVSEIGRIKKWKNIPKGFSKALNFTRGACSRNLNEPVLTCVHVNGKTIEGADNYRVVNYFLKEEIPIDAFLLPAIIVGTVINIKPVKIAEGNGWIHFKNRDEVILSCRIFEDEYVSTSHIIKIKGDEVIFPKNIIRILDKALIFAKRPEALDEVVEISLSKNKMIIKSNSETGSWFKEPARCEYSGDNVTFAITPYLLKDILQETKSAQIKDKKIGFIGDSWKYVSLLRGE